MKFIKFILLFLLGGFLAHSQNHSWKGYFSYSKIVDITSSSSQIYAASSSSVFVFDVSTKEIEIISSVEGLKTQDISTIFYSEKVKKLIIGNEDGSIQIINRNNGKITLVKDILNKKSIPPTEKRINSFIEHRGQLYIGTNYGISTLNLNNNQFGDSYFIGNNGENIKVNNIAVVGNWIYAATNGQGIKRAMINNPNLVDFKQWNVFDYGKWEKIINWNGQLTGVKADNKLYRFESSSTTSFYELSKPIVDLKVGENNTLMAVTNEQTIVFDSNTVVKYNIDSAYNATNGFSAATMLKGDVYVGTNASGLIQYKQVSISTPNYISPQGPISNKIFSLLGTPEGLWLVFGGYSREYNPHTPGLGSYGLSFYSSNQLWDVIPFDKLNYANSLSFASINPAKPGYLWVSSFHSGLLEIELNYKDIKNSNIKLYNHLNTGPNGLQKFEMDDYITVRVNGTAFDNEGNVWVTNSLASDNLKVMLANGDWESYNFDNIINSPKNQSFGAPVIDKNGTKWIPAYRNGLIAFNEKKAYTTMLINTSNGNLPETDVVSIAIDKNNKLWIGTDKGLRIIPNVDDFLKSNQLTTNSIIIKEDGIAQELFYQQRITKIKVDGANNKWVAIAEAGVFLVSPNGQETIYRFTKENSPLPSNSINDIEIDAVTGEVFFATNNGLVSFKGSATEPTDSYNDAFVYPNPVRPNFLGDVKISGLKDKSNVKITDVEGNLVYEATSEGGTVLWNTYSFSGKKVRSGVYLIFISSKDGDDKAIKKLMVIR